MNSPRFSVIKCIQGFVNPKALNIPTMPTPTQNTFRTVYALSFFIIAHQESITASTVLNAQTKRKGLCGPSQLTSEKLKILINTPSISMARRFRVTAAFSRRNSFMLIYPRPIDVVRPNP
jgi:hypothetical protein